MVPARCAILARFGYFVANLRTLLRTGLSSAVVYQIWQISGMWGGPKVVPRLALPLSLFWSVSQLVLINGLEKIPADFKHFGLCCADFKLFKSMEILNLLKMKKISKANKRRH